MSDRMVISVSAGPVTSLDLQTLREKYHPDAVLLEGWDFFVETDEDGIRIFDDREHDEYASVVHLTRDEARALVVAIEGLLR